MAAQREPGTVPLTIGNETRWLRPGVDVIAVCDGDVNRFRPKKDRVWFPATFLGFTDRGQVKFSILVDTTPDRSATAQVGKDPPLFTQIEHPSGRAVSFVPWSAPGR